jgi:hypothetical protein
MEAARAAKHPPVRRRVDAPTVAAARSSCRLPKESLMGMLGEKNDNAQVYVDYII